MARTSKNFKLTGRAASQELKDQREYIADAQRAKFQQDLKREQDEVILECIAIEGKESFWAWFDGDAVPNFEPTKERIALIRARIASLVEFRTIEERIDQIEENLLQAEITLQGDEYEKARHELWNELFHLSDQLQVYDLPVE